MSENILNKHIEHINNLDHLNYFNNAKINESNKKSNIIQNMNSDDDSCSTDTNNTNETNLSKIPDAHNAEFSPKEKIYFKSVDNYFKKLPTDNVLTMINIIEGGSIISLRLLDWFVTRYAYNKNIKYNKENSRDDDFESKFQVHISYKAQLKSYKKKYFDPFRRRKKFFYKFNRNIDDKLLTTLGQLHFFRWAFENDVIKYVSINYKNILAEMVLSNKEDKIRKKNHKNKKLAHDSNNHNDNTNIVVSAKQKINNKRVEIVLSFD